MSAKAKTIPLLPINGRVLILPQQKQTQTQSGLYLADSSSSEKPQRGVVVRLGLEKLDDNGNKVAFNVKEGMEVMYTRYAGDEIEYDAVKYILMEEKDIIGIVEE